MTRTKFNVYGLLAETNLHPGTGQDAGFVDQPVAREATTDYPVIVGSAAKGAIREEYVWSQYQLPQDAQAPAAISNPESKTGPKDHKEAITMAEQKATAIFGRSSDAGNLLVGDMRLLLLPVRSLTTSFVWITCPYLLERASRDCYRSGLGSGVSTTEMISDLSKNSGNAFLGLESLGKTIYLEERQFERQAGIQTAVVEFLARFIPHASTAARLPKQLAIIADDHFAWFARYGLPVTARNVLDRETKTSRNIWYEESIPADTLFYCMLGERKPGGLNAIHQMLVESQYLQVGGNETVGQGWVAVHHVAPTPTA